MVIRNDINVEESEGTAFDVMGPCDDRTKVEAALEARVKITVRYVTPRLVVRCLKVDVRSFPQSVAAEMTPVDYDRPLF